MKLYHFLLNTLYISNDIKFFNHPVHMYLYGVCIYRERVLHVNYLFHSCRSLNSNSNIKQFTPIKDRSVQKLHTHSYIYHTYILLSISQLAPQNKNTFIQNM